MIASLTPEKKFCNDFRWTSSSTRVMAKAKAIENTKIPRTFARGSIHALFKLKKCYR